VRLCYLAYWLSACLGRQWREKGEREEVPRCSVPRFSRELFPNDFVGNREAVPECCVVVLSC
jgi:hypothetical protein